MNAYVNFNMNIHIKCPACDVLSIVVGEGELRTFESKSCVEVQSSFFQFESSFNFANFFPNWFFIPSKFGAQRMDPIAWSAACGAQRVERSALLRFGQLRQAFLILNNKKYFHSEL